MSQAACFSFNHKRSHELALIRIGQYLKGTEDKGLILIPFKADTFVMEAYVDSDFLGIYGKEETADPDNVRSRTGYVIQLNGCPIAWSSHLQNSICVSTMMAEYYALWMCMREVLPLRDLVNTVARGCGLDEACQTTFKVLVWEDNVGALTLFEMQPAKLKCSRPDCDAHGCMKMQSGLHEAPKTALSPALMQKQEAPKEHRPNSRRRLYESPEPIYSHMANQ